MKKTGLGRGLAALLPNDSQLQDEKSILLCPIEEISPNRYQPRKILSDSGIQELAASIKEKGIIQPIIVRRAEDGYEIIAGERRWRAAQKAGLKAVPVIVKEASPAEVLELALIENIQRRDLNPLEEAEAYERLVTEFGLTQEAVAERVGKERSTVANFLRLLKLPDYIKQNLWAQKLTMGHARTLAGVEDAAHQRLIHDAVIKRSLSVRDTEILAKKKKAPRRKKLRKADANILAMEEELIGCLGTRVKILGNGKRGRIEIEFYSQDDLERIAEYITSRD